MPPKDKFRTLDDPEPPPPPPAPPPAPEPQPARDSYLVMRKNPQSVLWINEGFRVEFTRPMPGAWRRFWYRCLLGWRWEKL